LLYNIYLSLSLNSDTTNKNKKMGNLISRLQENFLVKLNSEDSNTSVYIREVLTLKRYETELTYFENKVISTFFEKGNDICCSILFYSSEYMLMKRLYSK
jgi:hypothetical protein